MNTLPMPSGVHSVPNVHKDIEIIAYLLEGVLSPSWKKFENETFVKRANKYYSM